MKVRGLGANALLAFGGDAASKAAALLVVLLAARLLSVDEFAAFATAFACAGLLMTALDLGAGTLLTRDGASDAAIAGCASARVARSSGAARRRAAHRRGSGRNLARLSVACAGGCSLRHRRCPRALRPRRLPVVPGPQAGGAPEAGRSEPRSRRDSPLRSPRATCRCPARRTRPGDAPDARSSHRAVACDRRPERRRQPAERAAQGGADRADRTRRRWRTTDPARSPSRSWEAPRRPLSSASPRPSPSGC